MEEEGAEIHSAAAGGIHEVVDKLEIDTAHAVKKTRLEGSQTFQRIRKDWVNTLKNGTVHQVNKRYKIASGAHITSAVRFMLHRDHVILL